jgi:hypothetical protein
LVFGQWITDQPQHHPVPDEPAPPVQRPCVATADTSRSRSGEISRTPSTSPIRAAYIRATARALIVPVAGAASRFRAADLPARPGGPRLGGGTVTDELPPRPSSN